MSEKIKGMFGHPKRAEEVKEWLKSQGAFLDIEYSCNNEELIYYFNEYKNDIDTIDGYHRCLFDIVELPDKIVRRRRMTFLEVAKWSREHPEEVREVLDKEVSCVYPSISYELDEADKEVPDRLMIRKNFGEWEEPIVMEE